MSPFGAFPHRTASAPAGFSRRFFFEAKMTHDLTRRIAAARIPVRKDWTPTPATHCFECGAELPQDAGRVWSRDLCRICRADFNRMDMYVEDACEE